MREVLDPAEYDLFTQAPFEVIHVPSHRATLVEVLEGTSSQERQLGLFGQPPHALELLDDIERAATTRPLYARWKQRVGNKDRLLSVPIPPLRYFIEQYLVPLARTVKTHAGCHGGEPGWSSRVSVASHMPAHTVLSFDLRDAFPNCPFEDVFNVFYQTLSGAEEESRRHCAGFLTFLSTVLYRDKDRRALPVGSPNAMHLFNRTLLNLDREVAEKAARRGFRYSRWVDDIIISTPDSVGLSEVMGAAAFVANHRPISPGKVYFQQGPAPIYLLGNIIEGGRIFKNSRAEVEANKSKPIDLSNWVGDQKNLTYTPW